MKKFDNLFFFHKYAGDLRSRQNKAINDLQLRRKPLKSIFEKFVEVGFRRAVDMFKSLIPQRAILKVAKLAYFCFITLIILIYYYIML